MTTAAAKATAAADALLAWLRDQPAPVFQRRASAAPVPAPAKAGAGDAPPGPATAGPPVEPAGEDGLVDHAPVAPASPVLATAQVARPMPRTAMTSGAGDDRGAPLSLAHTDWLYHRLAITGPAAALAAFRTAAAGAGIIPWHLDLDRMTEDCFHWLVAPPPHQRSLSLAGARILARQLRGAVVRRHDLALSRVGRSRACPLDLHALVPVPEDILQRGPDDAGSLQWLWQHWGTTRELRHVTAAAADDQDWQRQPAPGETGFLVSFWSADWSPWRALAQIAADFPALRFDLRPSYDPP